MRLVERPVETDPGRFSARLLHHLVPVNRVARRFQFSRQRCFQSASEPCSRSILRCCHRCRKALTSLAMRCTGLNAVRRTIHQRRSSSFRVPQEGALHKVLAKNQDGQTCQRMVLADSAPVLCAQLACFGHRKADVGAVELFLDDDPRHQVTIWPLSPTRPCRCVARPRQVRYGVWGKRQKSLMCRSAVRALADWETWQRRTAARPRDRET